MSDDTPPLIRRRAAGIGLGGLLVGARARAAPVDTPVRAGEQPSGLTTPPLPPGVRPVGAEVMVMGATSQVGLYTLMVEEIANVVAEFAPTAPRVLPIAAGGGPQAVWDVMLLDDLDGALLSSVVLDFVRRGGWLPDLPQRLTFVTQLYFEETHILSTDLIQNLYSLNGRTVNVGPLGGGNDVMARRLFDSLGVKPVYDYRPTLQALPGVPTGNPVAVLYVAGKPMDEFRQIQVIGNLRFVPIPWDPETASRLTPFFRSAVLRPDDYPRLVPNGTTVQTVASPVFLMWRLRPEGSPGQAASSEVIRAFLQNLNTLRYGPYHPKWREVNVLEGLPGFRRSPDVITWFNSTNNPDP